MPDARRLRAGLTIWAVLVLMGVSGAVDGSAAAFRRMLRGVTDPAVRSHIQRNVRFPFAAWKHQTNVTSARARVYDRCEGADCPPDAWGMTDLATQPTQPRASSTGPPDLPPGTYLLRGTYCGLCSVTVLDGETWSNFKLTMTVYAQTKPNGRRKISILATGSLRRFPPPLTCAGGGGSTGDSERLGNDETAGEYFDVDSLQQGPTLLWYRKAQRTSTFFSPFTSYAAYLRLSNVVLPSATSGAPIVQLTMQSNCPCFPCPITTSERRVSLIFQGVDPSAVDETVLFKSAPFAVSPAVLLPTTRGPMPAAATVVVARLGTTDYGLLSDGITAPLPRTLVVVELEAQLGTTSAPGPKRKGRCVVASCEASQTLTLAPARVGDEGACRGFEDWADIRGMVVRGQYVRRPDAPGTALDDYDVSVVVTAVTARGVGTPLTAKGDAVLGVSYRSPVNPVGPRDIVAFGPVRMGGGNYSQAQRASQPGDDAYAFELLASAGGTYAAQVTTGPLTNFSPLPEWGPGVAGTYGGPQTFVGQEAQTADGPVRVALLDGSWLGKQRPADVRADERGRPPLRTQGFDLGIAPQSPGPKPLSTTRDTSWIPTGKRACAPADTMATVVSATVVSATDVVDNAYRLPLGSVALPSALRVSHPVPDRKRADRRIVVVVVLLLVGLGGLGGATTRRCLLIAALAAYAGLRGAGLVDEADWTPDVRAINRAVRSSLGLRPGGGWYCRFVCSGSPGGSFFSGCSSSQSCGGCEHPAPSPPQSGYCPDACRSLNCGWCCAATMSVLTHEGRLLGSLALAENGFSCTADNCQPSTVSCLYELAGSQAQTSRTGACTGWPSDTNYPCQGGAECCETGCCGLSYPAATPYCNTGAKAYAPVIDNQHSNCARQQAVGGRLPPFAPAPSYPPGARQCCLGDGLQMCPYRSPQSDTRLNCAHGTALPTSLSCCHDGTATAVLARKKYWADPGAGEHCCGAANASQDAVVCTNPAVCCAVDGGTFTAGRCCEGAQLRFTCPDTVTPSGAVDATACAGCCDIVSRHLCGDDKRCVVASTPDKLATLVFAVGSEVVMVSWALSRYRVPSGRPVTTPTFYLLPSVAAEGREDAQVFDPDTALLHLSSLLAPFPVGLINGSRLSASVWPFAYLPARSVDGFVDRVAARLRSSDVADAVPVDATLLRVDGIPGRPSGVRSTAPTVSVSIPLRPKLMLVDGEVRLDNASIVTEAVLSPVVLSVQVPPVRDADELALPNGDRVDYCGPTGYAATPRMGRGIAAQPFAPVASFPMPGGPAIWTTGASGSAVWMVSAEGTRVGCVAIACVSQPCDEVEFTNDACAVTFAEMPDLAPTSLFQVDVTTMPVSGADTRWAAQFAGCADFGCLGILRASSGSVDVQVLSPQGVTVSSSTTRLAQPFDVVLSAIVVTDAAALNSPASSLRSNVALVVATKLHGTGAAFLRASWSYLELQQSSAGLPWRWLQPKGPGFPTDAFDVPGVYSPLDPTLRSDFDVARMEVITAAVRGGAVDCAYSARSARSPAWDVGCRVLGVMVIVDPADESLVDYTANTLVMPAGYEPSRKVWKGAPARPIAVNQSCHVGATAAAVTQVIDAAEPETIVVMAQARVALPNPQLSTASTTAAVPGFAAAQQLMTAVVKLNVTLSVDDVNIVAQTCNAPAVCPPVPCFNGASVAASLNPLPTLGIPSVADEALPRLGGSRSFSLQLSHTVTDAATGTHTSLLTHGLQVPVDTGAIVRVTGSRQRRARAAAVVLPFVQGALVLGHDAVATKGDDKAERAACTLSESQGGGV